MNLFEIRHVTFLLEWRTKAILVFVTSFLQVTFVAYIWKEWSK